MKIDEILQNGQYESNSNVPDSNCFRNVCDRKNMSFPLKL